MKQIFESPLKYQVSSKSVQWSRVVPCERTDGQTDMTKLRVAFGNFANAPKNDVHLKQETMRWTALWLGSWQRLVPRACRIHQNIRQHYGLAHGSVSCHAFQGKTVINGQSLKYLKDW
jgi:hypothetical protein